jgi:hypothetical protein
MHMHAGYPPAVRTTIEIADSQRAKLLALAAERGLKGFSALVREALDLYLREPAPHDARLDAALAACGSITAEDADLMRAEAARSRESWR